MLYCIILYCIILYFISLYTMFDYNTLHSILFHSILFYSIVSTAGFRLVSLARPRWNKWHLHEAERGSIECRLEQYCQSLGMLGGKMLRCCMLSEAFHNLELGCLFQAGKDALPLLHSDQLYTKVRQNTRQTLDACAQTSDRYEYLKGQET